MRKKKKEGVNDFESYVLSETGKPLSDLERSGEKRYETGCLYKAAGMIKEAVAGKRFIAVVTDYDADGINSAAEIYMILKKAGAGNKNMRVVIPRRLSDGYGLNGRILEGFPDGCLLITIDNGISAVNEIKAAKERGMDVIIMDHHLRRADGILPPADLIIDPEDDAEGWTYNGYCGAGLTWKLAEYMFPEDTEFLDELSVFAAIATVGDLVDVTGDNRNIIMRGLRNLNERCCTEAVADIADLLSREKNIEYFGCDEIAFSVAPMFNAPGRLSDEGGRAVLRGLFSEGVKSAEFAEWIFKTNEKRKQIVKDNEDISDIRGENISFAYVPDFPEGVCGILAAKIAEKTGKPSFVCTDASMEEGVLKGSARSDTASVFEIMSSCPELFRTFGGHAQAAGFSLKKEDLDALTGALDKAAPEPGEKTEVYDFDVDAGNLVRLYELQKRAAVFGVGLPRPVIRVSAAPQELKFIGKDKTTLRFKAGGITFVGFSMRDKYEALRKKGVLTVCGKLTANRWGGRETPQVQIESIE